MLKKEEEGKVEMEMEEGGVYGIKNHLDHLSVH